MADKRPSIDEAHARASGGASPIFALLRRYGRGRTPVLAVAVASTLADRVLSLAGPFLLGVMLDAFFVGDGPLALPGVPAAWIPAGTGEQFALLVGLFVAVSLLEVGVTAVGTLAWRWFQGSVVHELRTDAFDATQRLDVPFFDAERTGDVLSVLTNDVNQLREFLDSGLQNLVRTVAFVAALAVAMLALHWQLAVLVFAFAPVMAVAVRLYERAIGPRYEERRSAVGELNARIENAVSGIETVKAFTAEDRERERVAADSRSFWRADWRAARVSAVFFPLRDAVSQAAWLAVVVGGGWWALAGPPVAGLAPLSVGTFVTFYFYVSLFITHTSRLGDVTDTYADAKASAKRVFGLVAHPAAESDAGDATDLDSVDGRIAFEDVTFTYPEADAPAIRDVSFAVEPDSFVGLVGPTGAGKSTVLKLLLRFYDPDTGTVTVDGHPVADVTAESLRDAVGYVSQEPFLFDGTVRENIAYGTGEEVNDATVEAAARRANAHEFVTDLPAGYDTEIGERGVRLSGGQRQRIAIARAIVGDPDVLVLDEATSHVDNRTELLVQEALADVVVERTTFAVAHRLSTVRQADQLLVFEEGEVVERGTHEELLAADGVYADLWRIHVGETRSAPQLS